MAQYLNPQISNQHSSVLFSAELDLSGCEELSETDASLPLDEVLNNFMLIGGPWEQLAESVSEKMHGPNQGEVLHTARNAVCTMPNEQALQSGCEALNHPDSPYSIYASVDEGQVVSEYSSLLSSYHEQEAPWTDLAHSIDGSTLSDAQKSKALIVIKESFCSKNEI